MFTLIAEEKYHARIIVLWIKVSYPDPAIMELQPVEGSSKISVLAEELGDVRIDDRRCLRASFLVIVLRQTSRIRTLRSACTHCRQKYNAHQKNIVAGGAC